MKLPYEIELFPVRKQTKRFFFKEYEVNIGVFFFPLTFFSEDSIGNNY